MSQLRRRAQPAEPVQPSPMQAKRAGPSKRTLAAIILLVVAIGIAYVALDWRTRASAARLLPLLPDLTGRPPALVAHLREADAAARRAPASADAVGALGMAYHADLFYEQALMAYERAAALDSRNTGWRWPYLRALVHLERGDGERARDALTIVVHANPSLPLAWWRLGESEFKQARYAEADAAYARAESDPVADADGRPGVGPFARTGRARVALNRGDLAGAVAILTTLLDVNPRFAPAHRVLADAYRAQGRTADAERHGALGASLRAYTAPRDPELDAIADLSRSSVFLLRHAASLDLLRDAARRERIVRQALAADPGNPDVVYEMGATLQQLRRPADALPLFTQHLDLVDDDVQTLVQIGKCQTDLGRLEDAEATLRKALALGDDAVGYYNLGIVLEQRDRIDEADASYRRAIAVGPGLAAARNNLGALLAMRGRLDEADGFLLEAVRLDPSSPDAYTNLSAVRLQRRAFADAARYAGLAITLDPRLADAHVNLGVALANLGRMADARNALDSALRIDPRHENARRNIEALNQLGK